MGSILFVHGTGVRQDGYEKTFNTLQERLKKQPDLQDLTLERCLWGPVHGARLLERGGSMPGYSGALSIESEEEILKWWLLYQNPYVELESLNEKGDRQLPPRVRADWKTKLNLIEDHHLSAALEQLLRENGLDLTWKASLKTVTDSEIWRETLPQEGMDAERFFPDFCQCTAEAVMAETALAALDAGIPVPTGEIRDRIVRQFVSDLGATVRGPADWFAALGKGLKRLSLLVYAGGDYAVSKVVTKPVLRNFVTNRSLEAIGDILFYQANSERIGRFIEERINELEAPVFLLAHSLGGIACVDLLVRKDLRQRVAGLITAGSQSPLFYEMGCLVSLPRTSETPAPRLPEHFPPWLNFYDPNDYLSYAAKTVFHSDSRISDCEITSRQPRLMAHGAYWTEKMLWRSLAEFVRKHGPRHKEQPHVQS